MPLRLFQKGEADLGGESSFLISATASCRSSCNLFWLIVSPPFRRGLRPSVAPFGALRQYSERRMMVRTRRVCWGSSGVSLP